jgi:hypothetical protein
MLSVHFKAARASAEVLDQSAKCAAWSGTKARLLYMLSYQAALWVFMAIVL